MVGRDHIITSAAAGALASALASHVPALEAALECLPLVLVAAIAAVGGLLPDIDAKNSTISRVLGFHLPVRHRTVTHTIWIVLLLLLIAYQLRSGVFTALAIGYAMHLAMDSLSRGGVVWTWPFRRYLDETDGYTYHVAPGYGRPKLYTTGGEGEDVTCAAVTLGCLALTALLSL